MAVTTFDLGDVKRRMQGALNALKHDLGSLRTGRASPNLLDPIQVEAYGATMPISQVATVSVPEARLLSVQVWDRGMVHAVEKAIRDSDLGLNPAASGETVRVPMPLLTEERRKELIKVVKHEAENARVAVRNLRRDAISQLKDALKKHEISENDERRALDEMQKTTDRHIADIERLLQEKEKELLAV
jgi:ribosome recycling factor